MTIKITLETLLHLLYVASGLMAVGLAWAAVRPDAPANLPLISYPFAVTLCTLLVANYIVGTWWLYVGTGVAWGLLSPIRNVLRESLIKHGDLRHGDWSMLKRRTTYEITLLAALMHGIAWPVSTPVIHYFLPETSG